MTEHKMTVKQAMERARCVDAAGDPRILMTGFRNTSSVLVAEIERLRAECDRLKRQAQRDIEAARTLGHTEGNSVGDCVTVAHARHRAELAVAEKDHRAMEVLRQEIVIDVHVHHDYSESLVRWSACNRVSKETMFRNDPADAILLAAEEGGKDAMTPLEQAQANLDAAAKAMAAAVREEWPIGTHVELTTRGGTANYIVRDHTNNGVVLVSGSYCDATPYMKVHWTWLRKVEPKPTEEKP